MRTNVLLFAVVALAACQKPETTEQASARMAAESDSAKTAIDATNARYSRYISTNLADSAAMVFMDGGMLMPPGEKAVVGRDSIRAWMTKSPMVPGASIAIHSAEVAANGPIAIERGTYTFSMPAVARTPAVHVTGKYLAHWHKIAGTWQMAAEVWSDDVPSPPMAAK